MDDGPDTGYQSWHDVEWPSSVTSRRRIELTHDDHELILCALEDALVIEEDTFRDDPDPETGAYITKLKGAIEACSKFEVV